MSRRTSSNLVDSHHALPILITPYQFSSILLTSPHFSSLLLTYHHFSSLLITYHHLSSVARGSPNFRCPASAKPLPKPNNGTFKSPPKFRQKSILITQSSQQF